MADVEDIGSADAGSAGAGSAGACAAGAGAVCRVAVRNDRPIRSDGDFVLYWMTAARRTRWSFALDRALALGREHDKPVLVLEALRADYPFASARFHRFVLDGMADNQRRLAEAGVGYHAYVEPRAGAGRGLLAALAERAVIVVADDHPGSFFPRMLAAAAARLPVRLEAVDGNGLLPLAASDRAYPSAYAFRRFLQREAPAHLDRTPLADPLAMPVARRFPGLPADIEARWPRASDALLQGGSAGCAALAALPIDHAVAPVRLRGGAEAGRAALARFVEGRLARYPEARNHPDDGGQSGLSPYLHFGHVGAHEAFAAVAESEGWTPARIEPIATGARTGFWGMSEAAEAFVDQLVTWRELGFHRCRHRPTDDDRYDSLPEWAQRTLAKHAADPRPYAYDLDPLERAETHDPLWNAAQTELVHEGRIHTYLRMLWGKKVLEWTRSPQEALAILLFLNDRYALDGRDPNSVSGIFWIFGRYDRPWAPERPIFGTVRYMSSDSARRKLRLRGYLEAFSPERDPAPGELSPR